MLPLRYWRFHRLSEILPDVDRSIEDVRNSATQLMGTLSQMAYASIDLILTGLTRLKIFATETLVQKSYSSMELLSTSLAGLKSFDDATLQPLKPILILLVTSSFVVLSFALYSLCSLRKTGQVARRDSRLKGTTNIFVIMSPETGESSASRIVDEITQRQMEG